MTPRSTRLVASAIVLACALATTAQLAWGGAAPDAGTLAPLPRLEAHETAGPGALAPVSAFSAVAARPLFSPTRRPDMPLPAAPPPVAVATPATVAVPPPPPGTLLGVLISPHGASAILRLLNGRSETVREGGTVEGWRVKQVSSDRVLLVSDAVSAELTFPAARAAPAPVAGAAALPPLRRRR